MPKFFEKVFNDNKIYLDSAFRLVTTFSCSLYLAKQLNLYMGNTVNHNYYGDVYMRSQDPFTSQILEDYPGPVAEEARSTAIGDYAKATGDGSTAIGYKATAKGAGARAEGKKASAEGPGAVAIGDQARATGRGSKAIGSGAEVAGRGASVVEGSDVGKTK